MTRSTQQAFGGAALLMDDGFLSRLRLAWRLLRDDRVTPLKFVVPVLLGLYIASPIDTIPDVLLGIGQLDDLGIVVIALMLFVRIMPGLAPSEVVAEHMAGSRRTGESGHRDRPGHSQAVEADFRVHR